MEQMQSKVDHYAKYGRSVIRIALGILLLVLIISVGLALGVGDADRPALRHAQALAPICIILIVIIAQQRRRKLGKDTDGTIWNALFNDEFRQRSLARSFRTAFIFLLIAQLPLGFLMDTFLQHSGMFFMGYLSLLTGVIAFLSCFLYFDRGVD